LGALTVVSALEGPGLTLAVSGTASGLGWVLTAVGGVFGIAWLVANYVGLQVRVVSDDFVPFNDATNIGEIEVELRNRRFRRAIDVTGFRLVDSDASVPRLIQRPYVDVAEEVARRSKQRGTWGGLVGPRKSVRW
jgi:hypothetical protein